MSKRESGTRIGKHRQVADADAAYKSALTDVLAGSREVVPSSSMSIGSGRKFKEILGYELVIGNPLERLVWNPKRRLNLPGATARFVWMMAANDRLKDIEYYWGNKISPFTDDGIIVPGSCYGHRILNPQPGCNQINGVIGRLREDSASRRATVAVYQAEDATRSSKDIPCTFGFRSLIEGSFCILRSLCVPITRLFCCRIICLNSRC